MTVHKYSSVTSDKGGDAFIEDTTTLKRKVWVTGKKGTMFSEIDGDNKSIGLAFKKDRFVTLSHDELVSLGKLIMNTLVEYDKVMDLINKETK